MASATKALLHNSGGPSTTVVVSSAQNRSKPAPPQQQTSSGRRRMSGAVASNPSPLPLASADPFAHISIVHSFVGKINADCISRRFLICLRDHLPFVGIERGCDVIAEYARKCLLRKAKYNAGIAVGPDDVVMRLRLIIHRGYRRLRGKRKLKALISDYARRRRNDILSFVQQWTLCEHATQRQVKVTFLEYSVTHVSVERKRVVAASYRIRCIHQWVIAMRTVMRQQRQQRDNFYLWLAQHNRAVSTNAFFAIRTMAMETLKFRRVMTVSGGQRCVFFEPKISFGLQTTLRDVVLEEARLRFSGSQQRPKGSPASFRGSDDTDRGLLRRLVIQRTQRASLVDPDILVDSAYLRTRIATAAGTAAAALLAPKITAPSTAAATTTSTNEVVDLGAISGCEEDWAVFYAWSMDEHPLFMQPPTSLPHLLREDANGGGHPTDPKQQQLAVAMAVTDARRRSVAEASQDGNTDGSNTPTGAAASRLSVSVLAGTTRRLNLSNNGASPTPVAIPKTVISMVGDQWIMNPLFAGRVQHVALASSPLLPNTRGFSGGDPRGVKGAAAAPPRAFDTGGSVFSHSAQSSPRGFTSTKTFNATVVAPEAPTKVAMPQGGGGWRDMVRRYEHSWAVIQQQHVGKEGRTANMNKVREQPPTQQSPQSQAKAASEDEHQESPTPSPRTSNPRVRSAPRRAAPSPTTATMHFPKLPTGRHATVAAAVMRAPLDDGATMMTATTVSLSPRSMRPSTSHSRYYGHPQHRPFPEMERLGLFKVPSSASVVHHQQSLLAQER